VSIDVAAPAFRPPGEAASQRRQQAAIRHLLRTQHRGSAAVQADANEPVPVRPAGPQHGGRQKAGFGQPGPGAVRLDDMPYLGIACRQPGGTVGHAMPSTSIIE
jgi:hypothetical protein